MNFQPALVDQSHPLEIREELAPDVLALDEALVRSVGPVRVEVLIEKQEEGDFLVTGWALTEFSLVCGRCAEWFPFPIRAKVEHVFEAPHPNVIDLIPFVREDVLLELPLNAACRLGADGRCPVTGEIYQPLPESTGSLAGEEVWEALSKIKPKK